jgi:4'-phosphopantetheinyl transferase
MDEAFPLPELPPKTTIDVWRFELDRSLNIAIDLNGILSTEERKRAERFVFARDVARFRLGRAMLRLGLGWYLGRPPREVVLTTGWRGKPCLDEPSGLQFNVTHCDGLALMAFTTGGEVGIDVESVQRNVEALDIANANFTPTEAAMIASVGTAREQSSIFLRFWTRKEAVLKAAGGGLLHGLDTVDVSQDSPSLAKLSGGREARAETCWLLRDLEGIEGFVGAVAAPPGDWSIREWDIRCEDAFRRIEARFPGVL